MISVVMLMTLFLLIDSKGKNSAMGKVTGNPLFLGR